MAILRQQPIAGVAKTFRVTELHSGCIITPFV